ncbi:exodeoxyribonuclease V subunit gamma [Paenibacillus sp. CC-CFT747]|nr:exodeoxyribonuclease V subunit gamma [Paenibacillus sp. CC-CFT747]
MGLRFVMGRAGTGKSTLCLKEIRKRLEESPEGHPLLLLVPEQSTFQVEQALLESPEIKGYTRAQVFSFRRLAWRVMQETGHTAGVPIDDLGKAMLLQRVIHKRRKEWKVFQQAEGEMGLIGKMTRFFKELKRCGITPEDWEAHTSELPADREGTGWKDKLEDLSLLYREYESELAGLYLDTESFLPRLAAAMQDCSLLGDAELWVDGFFGFTPQELEVIVKCALHCRQVTVTLCLDRPYDAGERPDELDLFHPTARAMIRLKEQLDAHGAEPTSTEILDGTAPPRFAGSPMLAHLERQYALRNPSRGGTYRDGPVETGKPSVSVHAAVHRRAEVEGAAREMLRLVRDEGLRWRDLSVRVRKLGDYSELIGTVFPEYGIPYFLDEKRSVVHHPLVEFIRSSLEIIQHNWRYEAVFRCVKTDFLLPLEGRRMPGPSTATEWTSWRIMSWPEAFRATAGRMTVTGASFSRKCRRMTMESLPSPEERRSRPTGWRHAASGSFPFSSASRSGSRTPVDVSRR